MINKNFTTVASVVAALATVAVSAGSAEAANFSGNIDTTIDFSAGSIIADFSNGTIVGVDPDFSVAGTPVAVQDLTLTATTGNNASNSAISSFITGFQYQGIDAVFDLFAGMDTLVFPSLSGDVAINDFIFNGEIKSLSGDLLATATGAFSAIQTSTNDNFSVDLAATPVPTPAMLPGLVGMGMAFARKRKKQSEVAA